MGKHLFIYFFIASIVLSIGLPSYLTLSNSTDDTSHVIIDSDSEENTEEFELEIIQIDTSISLFKEVEFSEGNIYILQNFSSINKTLESPPPEV